MTTKRTIFIALTGLFYNIMTSQNATITIKNKSDRFMNVKLMQGNDRKNVVFKTDSVAPKGTIVFDVYETGFYFTKTRAILIDKKDATKNDTIYSKDRPMQLVSDKKRGRHSNVTIEYKIKESKENGSVTINRKEYDN
jgi:hypothetical protein